MPAQIWTASELEQAKAAWLARTMSSAVLAEKLSANFARRVTRGAVMGALHRAGLLGKKPRRAMIEKPQPKRSTPFNPPPSRRTVEPPRHPWHPPPPGGVLLFELGDDSCHWPLAALDEVATRFCGATVEAVGAPYCAAHARRAYAQRRS